MSADRLPRPAAANSVVVDPGRKSFSTIDAALDSITDASEGRQYVVSIGAGTYNEVVTCKSWVFLSGAGPGQTLITSQANSVVPATVTAASHSAVQNCTIRATTTGPFGVSVTAVYCPGAVDFDIENCELLTVGTSETNIWGLILDYWTEATGSRINISYTTVTAKGGASPLALSTGFYSYVHGMESRFVAEGGQQPWGCAAGDQSILLVENCHVEGAEYSLWQDSSGAQITANQCQLNGPVGPGVVVHN